MRASRVVAAFAVLALAVIAGVAWLLLRESRSQPSAGPTGSAELEVTTGPGAPASVRLEIGTPVGSLTRASPGSRKAVREPPPPEGPTLVVLAAENSRPLPDAEVWLVPRADVTDEQWRALDRFETDLEPILEEGGKRVELDALATAKLDGAHDRGFLIATTPDRGARREIALDGGERLVLKLARREALILRAIDPDGRRQAEVPVLLQTMSVATTPAEAGSVRFLGATDHVGEARVPWGRELLESHLDAFGLAYEKVVVAALAFPCREPRATPIDPRRDYRDPVDLVTPPRSTLRLRAVDLQGQPLAQAARASVTFAPKEKAVAPTWPIQREWPVEVPADGRAELVVEANLDVTIAARSVAGDFAALAKVTTASVADLLDVTLRFHPVECSTDPTPTTSCVVTIRDVDRQPLTSRELLWQVDDDRDAQPRTDARRGFTDEEGRLRCEIPDAAFATPLAALHVFVDPERPPSWGARYDGSARLHPKGEAPPFELPTIELREVPLLLGLTTVDVRGRTLAGVDVSVTSWLETWSGRTDEEGRFRVRVRPRVKSSTLSVRATRPGWWRMNEYDSTGKYQPIEVAAGASHVEIVLREKGIVEGRILVEPGISLDGLHLELDPSNPPDVESRLHGDGSFRVLASPSIRDFVVHSQWSDRPAAVVKNVEFREGERTHDPRLEPLDLTDVFRQMELRTIDREGAAVPGARVWLLTGRNQLIAGRRPTDAFGRALVTTPALGASLAVTHPDHALRRIALDRADLEVVLDPAYVVAVKLSGSAEKLERLQATPTLALISGNQGRTIDELVRGLAFEPATRAEDGRWFWKTPIAGTYVVGLDVAGKHSDVGWLVEVKEDADVTEAAFELTAREIEKLERIAGRRR